MSIFHTTFLEALKKTFLPYKYVKNAKKKGLFSAFLREKLVTTKDSGFVFRVQNVVASLLILLICLHFLQRLWKHLKKNSRLQIR